MDLSSNSSIVEKKARNGILGKIDECNDNQQQIIFLMSFNFLIPFCNIELIINSKKIDELIKNYLNKEITTNQYLDFDYFYSEIQLCIQDCNIYFEDCLKLIIKWMYQNEIHPNDLIQILSLLGLHYI